MNILAIMYCSCLTLDPTSVIYTKMAAQKNKSCAIPGIFPSISLYSTGEAPREV